MGTSPRLYIPIHLLISLQTTDTEVVAVASCLERQPAHLVEGYPPRSLLPS